MYLGKNTTCVSHCHKKKRKENGKQKKKNQIVGFYLLKSRHNRVVELRCEFFYVNWKSMSKQRQIGIPPT